MNKYQVTFFPANFKNNLVNVYSIDLNNFLIYAVINFVIGSPFLCRVNDGGSDLGGSHVSYGSGTGHSKVTLDLEHLGLIPVSVPSHFTIRVAGGDDAELAVSVQGNNLIF